MSNRTRTITVGIIGFALGVIASSAWNMRADASRPDKTSGSITERATERPILPVEASEAPSTPTHALASDDAASNDQAKVLVGKVVSLNDGDTVTLLDATNTQHKIRLEGIDAPESKQDFGTKSREALAEKVFEKQVRVEVSGTDRFGRKLGHTYIAERWINKELVAEGWAWHYKFYSDDADLAAAEVAARDAKLGLWADPQPQPPWEFRTKPKSAP